MLTKPHRPAQSGSKADKKDKGKGKEKQHGFNEKVRVLNLQPKPLLSTFLRLLPRDRAVGLTVKGDETLSATKHDYMFLL